jgi:Anaphase-promoting complex subunit 5
MSSLADAASYLTSGVVCVAIAAGSAAAGRPAAAALPRLAALTTPPPSLTYAALLAAFADLPLLPLDAATPSSTSSDDDSPAESIADYVDATISVLDSVHALYSAVDELLPPDHDLDGAAGLVHGVYARDGTVALFLRKVSVMVAALPFEAAAALVSALAAYREGRGGVVLPPADGAAALVLSGGAPLGVDEGYAALAAARPRFTAHVEAVRRRDYAAAVHALHRHFDLTLADIARKPARGEDGEDGESEEGSGVGEARGHQYAALSLAAAHFHLGHPRLAVAALDDAVRAAQQCGDDVSQSRALEWIARTSLLPEQRHQLLRHSRDRLALAREELLTVVTPFARDARVAVEAVEGEGFWRREHRVMAAVGAARMDRIHSRVGFQAGDTSVAALLVSAAAWESHAALPVALVVARMALRTARRRRRQRRRGAAALIGQEVVLTTAEAQAMAAVAALDAKSGRADEAIGELLKVADSKDSARIKPDFALGISSSRPEREILKRCATWLQFERALRRGETRVAGRLAEIIATFASATVEDGELVSGADTELDAIEARARWHIASQDFEAAVEAGELLSRRAAALTRPPRVADGARLMAQAHISAGAANSALPHALSAVSLSRGLGLEAAHTRSVLTLAEAMLRMDGGGSAEAAAASARTLHAVLPRAIEGLSMSERGLARRLEAESLLARSRLDEDRKAVGEVVSEELHAAIDAYATADDRLGLRDCWYMLARVRHEVGDTRGRDGAAAAFREQVTTLAQAETVFAP